MNNEILKALLAQEHELQLQHFNNATAWELGNLIRLGAEKISAAVSIEVYAFEQVVFSYAMPGTSNLLELAKIAGEPLCALVTALIIWGNTMRRKIVTLKPSHI